jgi:S-(hydroxymethyl)glutathione dehydrogenase/alcohol dehydrogenase
MGFRVYAARSPPATRWRSGIGGIDQRGRAPTTRAERDRHRSAENKREGDGAGATHAFATAEEAQQAINDLTRRGADSAILTVGLMMPQVVAAGFNAIGKGGVVVVTGLNKMMEPTIQLPGSILTLFRKTVKGTLFGDCNPTYDIPKLLGLYRAGDLKLDELITQTYTLDQVNEGYDDLLAGKNVRGVIVHQH